MTGEQPPTQPEGRGVAVGWSEARLREVSGPLADAVAAGDGRVIAARHPDEVMSELMAKIAAGEVPAPPEVDLVLRHAATPEARAAARPLLMAMAELYTGQLREAAEAPEGNPGLPAIAALEPGGAVRYHDPGPELTTLGNRKVRNCRLCGTELTGQDPSGNWGGRNGWNCPGPRTDPDADGDALRRELTVPRGVRFEPHPDGDSVIMLQDGRPAGRFPWAVVAEMQADLRALLIARFGTARRKAIGKGQQ